MSDFTIWDDETIKNANDISNRYQIVAHLIERGFLDKSLFFENFSGTLMNIWELCAPLIAYKRRSVSNVLYLRRDLERVALQAWLYQINLNFKTSISLLDECNNLEKIEPTPESISKVKIRIKYLKRLPQRETDDELKNLID